MEFGLPDPVRAREALGRQKPDRDDRRQLVRGLRFIWHTATPFTVRTSTDTTNSFSAGPLRADVIRNPNLPASQRRLTRWFDTEAFVQPAPYLFGNQGINIVRGDGRLSWNASVLRDFPVRENMRFQLRGEVFNVLNHANFDVPGAQLNAPGYGVVSRAFTPRQAQVGARLLF